MKLSLTGEKTVVTGKTYEDSFWGYMQFPMLYQMADGNIGLSIHIADDAPHELVQDSKIFYVSQDKGESWRKAGPEDIGKMGTRLPNGDMLRAYPIGTRPLSGYKEKPFRLGNYHIPSDRFLFGRNDKEDELPDPIALHTDAFGSRNCVYYLDTLPRKVAEKRFRFMRLRQGETVPEEMYASVEWNYRTVETYSPSVIYDPENTDLLLNDPGLFNCRRVKVAPDSSLWIAHYSHCGADPYTGVYHGKDCVYFFRSTDNGESWKLVSWIPYVPDPKNPYAYMNDGFSEPSIEFIGNNTMLCLLRTCSVFQGAPEWGPSYLCRSDDGGLTWSEPTYFADRGALPHLLKLENGILLAVITRPGIYVYASADGGKTWVDRMEIMTDKDRSGLMNHAPARPNFWQWAGSCCNTSVQAVDRDKALLAYSDFYIPDADGVKRKGIKTIILTAEL